MTDTMDPFDADRTVFLVLDGEQGNDGLAYEYQGVCEYVCEWLVYEVDLAAGESPIICERCGAEVLTGWRSDVGDERCDDLDCVQVVEDAVAFTR
jgi:hypothetical protein